MKTRGRGWFWLAQTPPGKVQGALGSEMLPAQGLGGLRESGVILFAYLIAYYCVLRKPSRKMNSREWNYLHLVLCIFLWRWDVPVLIIIGDRSSYVDRVSWSLGLCCGCPDGLDVLRVTDSRNPECHSVQTLTFLCVCWSGSWMLASQTWSSPFSARSRQVERSFGPEKLRFYIVLYGAIVYLLLLPFCILMCDHSTSYPFCG